MGKADSTFSMVRLNGRATGFAVIDDRTGALARPEGALALKLTAFQALQLVQRLNGGDAPSAPSDRGDQEAPNSY